MEFMSRAIELAGIYFTTGVRWFFLILSIFILARQIRSLLQARNPSEIWAYLGCPDDTTVPLTHWENLIGRSRGCDVILNLSSVSRSHGTLIRDSEGVWKYNDLNSKNGSAINGRPVKEPTVLKAGDVLTIGGSDFTLYPVSLEERMSNIEKRKQRTHPVSPWPSLVALTLFQFLMCVQFKVALAEDFPPQLPFAVGLLCALMWAYVIIMRMFRRVGFEMEIIAFYLCTLSLAVTASAYPSTVLKQSICICLGVGLFFGLCWFLRDLNRAKRIIYIMMGISVLLLIVNLAFGTMKYGAANWVSIGGFTLQPSELVKIVFIYVGAATLDELQQRKNLMIFMGFSVFCLGCLALMGDFGTALIFFVTFLIISFLRSGDFSKIVLILGASGLMGMMVLRFKPYISKRFDTWGHVWDDPTGGGFQQVQTMTASASGGLPGLGAGNGKFSQVAAAPTDLVFGLLSEEWGLIIAILAVLCIITLGVFAVRSIIAGRSTYYSIAACAATSMFIFQTILNVFGSIDLLPLTGVTFPFVSAGGTSMIASWGLLSFLKAADTRQNASFAIRLDKKGEFEKELEGGGLENPEDIFAAVDGNRHSYEEERSRNRRQRPAAMRQPDSRDYATRGRSNDTTIVQSSSSRPSRQIHYENISDDDFFNNLEQIRPGDSFGERWMKDSPSPAKKPQGRASSSGRSGQSRSARPAGENRTARPATGRSSSPRPASQQAAGRSSSSRPAFQQTAGRNNAARPAGRSGGQQSATGQRTSHAAQPQRQVQGQRPAPQRSSAQRPAPQRSASQRPSSQRPASQQPPRRRQQEENQQLTLEDIFGGDNK